MERATVSLVVVAITAALGLIGLTVADDDAVMLEPALIEVPERPGADHRKAEPAAEVLPPGGGPLTEPQDDTLMCNEASPAAEQKARARAISYCDHAEEVPEEDEDFIVPLEAE
jgi:hypothetical protein